MARLRDLQFQRGEIVEQMEALVRHAELQNRAMTSEEQKRYKELSAKAEELDQAINDMERRTAATLTALNAGLPVANVFRHVGGSPAEFSLTRLIRGMLDAREGRANPFRDCELEVETSRSISRSLGREPRGFFVPVTVLASGGETRDLVKGTLTAGGHLVATDLLGANFIGLLRNSARVIEAGATVLGGLIGDVDIPRQTQSATAYWVAEGAAPTESQQAFDRVTLRPKTVGAYTDISRKMLLQSSIDVENLVRQDLTNVLGLAIDKAALHGSGSGEEPTGIANTSGVSVVAGGTNGAAPTWEHIVDLESAVAGANAATGRLAYMTNSKVRGKLKTTPKVTGQATFVWGDAVEMLNGYPAYITNQVRSDLVKGTANNCSAIFFGNWADLLIGMWGALDILVDPFTHSTTGTVRVVAFQDVDIAVRHPESFAVMLDALT